MSGGARPGAGPAGGGRPAVVLAGLGTLDVIQLVGSYPADNEKVTAIAQTVAAGGPATNAAATVAHLGGAATLLTAVGRHPLGEARRRGIPALLDAGSWKPVTPRLLPLLDVVVCSADFRPPGAESPREVAAFLAAAGVRWIAISRGGAPTLRWTGDGFASHPVPRVEVVDTLGAGDVLHGALALAVARGWPLDDATFAAALDEAAAVATRSCASFGTRSWMSGSAR